jgi:hypothetical protein
VADLIAYLVGAVFGVLPARQPWRGLALALYIAGAVAGVVVLVLLIVRTV